ncbi:cyclin-A2 [Neodiprion pinetum]|uniref:Cyclin-A2 n=1 Tax=Neodiprion lecontei TaxID=441921 RepID=A0A6J0C4C7_NEOLC|nr:cyclin-A2 [Neodiprion lecontei]XP_046431857.1 cyclin-A2 [Neodiprion fabricii]XP_046488532.1 cyclin-A2 [Neodiprion pinetum]XP_046625660.1 cyclin-A2 [Neodiprion virginianus]
MATIRVHEDQENRITDILRGKENISIPNPSQGLQQSKRAVLGVINNNCLRTSKPEIGNKDEKYPKAKAFVSSQYETFKIYEDKKDDGTFNIYEDKLEKETSVALRETKESKETKGKQIADMTKVEREMPVLDVVPPILPSLRAALQEINKKKRDEPFFPQESPMSLEKSICLLDSSRKDIAAKREASKALRLNFFDVDEYRADIYNYLRSAETQHRPKPGYMKKQPDITYSMRSILVDWLVEVAEEYRLHSETLYLAVSYIDRFLSYMSVVRAKLQLVGTAAMFIAAKYEEIYPPDVGEFVYITDDTYTKKQVLRMEHLILRVLSFDLTVPTPLAFLTDFCISNNLSEKIQYLAMYLCELSMLEADPYLAFLPSHLAASAIALARHTLNEEAWPEELALSTGYNFKELKGCISCLTKTFSNACNIQQQAIQEKYKSSKYGHVALLLPRSSDVLGSEDDGESA